MCVLLVLNVYCKSVFLKLCECSTNRFVSRSFLTNACVFYIFSVLFIELFSMNDLYGEMFSLVIVFLCFLSVISDLFFILVFYA